MLPGTVWLLRKVGVGEGDEVEDAVAVGVGVGVEEALYVDIECENWWINQRKGRRNRMAF